MRIRALLLLLLIPAIAKPEYRLEVGETSIKSQDTGWMVTLTDRINDRYDITLGWITDQTFQEEGCTHPSCTWFLQRQLFFGGEFVFKTPVDGLRFGVGPYIFQNPDRVAPTRFRVGVHFEYRFQFWGKHLGISGRHFSTAGSGPIGKLCRREGFYETDQGFFVDRNDPNPPGYNCKTNDWNTGQDSWLRLTYYF